MAYTFQIIEQKCERGFVGFHKARVVDECSMPTANAAGWKLVLNHLAFRSHTKSNGHEVGSHQYSIKFIGKKPRGHAKQTLIRMAW